MQQKNESTPNFDWAVRIDSTLRAPVTLLAINKKTQIRQIVSDAVRDTLNKQKTGE